jgi:GntR family transcriptional regulator
VLDPALKSPLYFQLAELLRGRIRRGELPAGSSIPSEHELSASFGLGRPTVRQATELLVREGLLERRRGAGTFVRPLQPKVDLFTLEGTIAAFAGAGLALTTTVVEKVARHTLLPSTAGPLSDRPGFAFSRLGTLAGVPVLFEHLFLSATVFPGFDALPLEQAPLSHLVAEHYRLVPSGGHQTLRVTPVGLDQAVWLGVKKRHAVLAIERHLDFDGAPAALVALGFLLTEHVVLAQDLGRACGLPKPKERT